MRLVNYPKSADLAITYKNKKVENATLLLVKIFNSGNTSILKTDYETPIELLFAEKSEIIYAGVEQKKPEDLEIRINTKRNRISVHPGLMNRGDWFLIGAFVSNYHMNNKLILQGRINGIKNIEKSIVEKAIRPIIPQWLDEIFKTLSFCINMGLALSMILIGMISGRNILFFFAIPLLLLGAIGVFEDWTYSKKMREVLSYWPQTFLSAFIYLLIGAIVAIFILKYLIY